LKNKELVRDCEAETVKKIRDFRLNAKHKVPYKKNVVLHFVLMLNQSSEIELTTLCVYVKPKSESELRS